jgi:hypothetical protein
MENDNSEEIFENEEVDPTFEVANPNIFTA